MTNRETEKGEREVREAILEKFSYCPKHDLEYPASSGCPLCKKETSK